MNFKVGDEVIINNGKFKGEFILGRVYKVLTVVGEDYIKLDDKNGTMHNVLVSANRFKYYYPIKFNKKLEEIINND